MSQCKKSFAERGRAVSNLFHASVGTLPMQTHNKKELVVGRFKEDLQVMGWVELSRSQVPKW